MKREPAFWRKIGMADHRDPLLEGILEELGAHRDGKYRANMASSFGIKVEGAYGVRISVVRQIAKDYYPRVNALSPEDLLASCDRLLATRIQECRFIAFDWAYRSRKRFREQDFKRFEEWLAHDIEDWSACDDLCTHMIGAMLIQYPSCLPRLRGWTRSPNRWIRRGAAVSLIVPAKKGLFFTEICEIADALLGDSDALVLKGAGWMLKSASNAHPGEVFAFVYERRALMPRTMLRYAIEKLPPEQRKKAMEKAVS